MSTTTAPPPARRKLTIVNRSGEHLAALLERPSAEPVGYAIFAHCFTCSKDIAAASRISRALVAHGVGVVRFDFTGIGSSDGDFSNTNFSSNISDLIQVADHLRQHLMPAFLLIGHSLGGAAVLAAAGEIPEVSAVVTIGAPAEPGHVTHLFASDREQIERTGKAQVNLAGRKFTITREFIEDIEQQRLADRIRSMRKALLVMHSPIDSVVEIDNAARIFAAAKHPKSFVSLDDADHLLTDKRDAEYAAATIAAWASRYVIGRQPGAARPTVGDTEVLVREVGDRLTQTIFTARHHLAVDEPRHVGGADTGPDPYQLLLASLGACTAMTLRLYATRRNLPLTRVSVRLRHQRIHASDCTDCAQQSASDMLDSIERSIELEGELDAAMRSKLLQIADRCPVHRSLANPIRIVTTDAALTAQR